MRPSHKPKQRRARANRPAPVNSRRTEALLPESRGSKLYTGFPTAFWRFRTDGLPLKGGAMYTPCFGGSSAERKDISLGFSKRLDGLKSCRRSCVIFAS